MQIVVNIISSKAKLSPIGLVFGFVKVYLFHT